VVGETRAVCGAARTSGHAKSRCLGGINEEVQEDRRRENVMK